MATDDNHNQTQSAADQPIDEGGLRAPPGLTGWRKAWWWFDFIILVKLARLRFVAVLLVIGLVITQWDTLLAYYDRWTRPFSNETVAGSDVEFFCPMHPTVVRPTNREKCPVCFMPLSKRKKGEQQDVVLPAGTVSRVQLSPYRVVLAGIQTYPVDFVPLEKTITATGYVDFNERLQRTVAARVDGRIDDLYANETGRFVKAGDDLALFYSPELNVTMQNLLDAKRANQPDLMASARNRLRLFGIDDDQIDDTLAAGKAEIHLRIRSPISGHIIRKYVQEGQYVDEGTPLYDLAGLSTVWIQAQIYEDDMAALPLENIHQQDAEVTSEVGVTAQSPAFPGKTFRGKLSFIYPHVDQATRSVTVRCEVENSGAVQLMPGATAIVTLQIKPKGVTALRSAVADSPERQTRLLQGYVLAVPETAVIATGNQAIVYRESTVGVYDGTLVTLGPQMSGANGVIFYPVLNGLEPGDKVVTSGSFLVDAETRLNPAAGSIYYGGGESSPRTSAAQTVRPSTPPDVDRTIEAALAKLPSADRAAAEAQTFCAVLHDSKLGSMGMPIKLQIDGRTVFVCCENCVKQAKAKPRETLDHVEQMKARRSKQAPADEAPPPGPTAADPKAVRIRESLAKLAPDDRLVATAQRECPIHEGSPLGAMGVPVKLTIDGHTVFICCEGCQEDALANPQTTVRKARLLRESNGKTDTPPANSQP